jgi:hypothetical protein
MAETKRETKRKLSPQELAYERSRKAALAAQERGEAVLTLGEEVFRAADRPMNAWHMIKIAQAERRGNASAAMAHFADLMEQAVHPDDLVRMDQHLSMVAPSFGQLQEQIGELLVGAAKEAGFGEEEEEDPTTPPESGRPSSSPTSEASGPDSSWPDDPPIQAS